MGNLYIVSTPIGNLQDITIRAIKTLFSVDVIFSEQAQKTSLMLTKLLALYPQLIDSDRKPKLISFNEFEEEMKIYEVFDLIEHEKNVALVSEAGTPLISDPGFKLVRIAQEKGISVISIPGASAVTAALSISGLPTDKFLFLGFPPKSPGTKANFFEKLRLQLDHAENLQPTIIFFESPHRISQTLQTLNSVFGDIEITIARELTKIHEEVVKLPVSQMVEHDSIKNPKGEFVVLFNLKNMVH